MVMMTAATTINAPGHRQPSPPSTTTFVRHDGSTRVGSFVRIHRPGDSSLVDVLEREQRPGAGDAPQFVDAGVPELEWRPDDQVLHRAGDEDLARSRERHHAGARVHPDPPDVSVDRLDLTRVHTRANLEPDRANVLDDPLGSSHRMRRLVECREEAVAGEALFPAALNPQTGADHVPESAQEGTPPRVAHIGGYRRRTHDVEEEHGRETTPTLTSRHDLSMLSGQGVRYPFHERVSVHAGDILLTKQHMRGLRET
jgi:hypothetical protein